MALLVSGTCRYYCPVGNTPRVSDPWSTDDAQGASCRIRYCWRRKKPAARGATGCMLAGSWTFARETTPESTMTTIRAEDWVVSRVVAWVALTRLCGHLLLWRNLITVFFGVNTRRRRGCDANPRQPAALATEAGRACAADASMQTHASRRMCRKALVLSTLRAINREPIARVQAQSMAIDACAATPAATCTRRAGACAGPVPNGIAVTVLRESARPFPPPRLPRNEGRRAVPGVLEGRCRASRGGRSTQSSPSISAA